MSRRALPLALLAALVFSSPALAVVNTPEGAPAKEGQEQKGSLPTAGQAQEAAKAIEKRETDTSKSVEDMLRKANESARTPSSSSEKGQSSGRKAIYGDIIIHK